MMKKGLNATMHRIQQYDGYCGRPIWKQPENNSTYYNFEVDKQCKVPLRNIEQVMTELGIC